MNMTFISSREVKKWYISFVAKLATHEIWDKTQKFLDRLKMLKRNPFDLWINHICKEEYLLNLHWKVHAIRMSGSEDMRTTEHFGNISWRQRPDVIEKCGFNERKNI